MNLGLNDLRERVHDRGYHLQRVGLQTVVATTATFGLVTWLDLPDRSWAIISALLTIGISADAAYSSATGRVGGAVMGALLGLAATLLFGDAVLISLILAATLANVLATIWRSLSYAAVTAAVLALDTQPDITDSLLLIAAIVSGTTIGAATGLFVWPISERRRVIIAVQGALSDCRDLLALFDQQLETGDHQKRDEVHERFLSHLMSARGHLGDRRFVSRQATGMDLRKVVQALEGLWHALVILDRVLRSQRHEIDTKTFHALRPVLEQVQQSADSYIEKVIAATRAPENSPPSPQALSDVSREAFARIDALQGEQSQKRDARTKVLHSLIFALDETERRLSELAAVVGRTDTQDSSR